MTKKQLLKKAFTLTELLIVVIVLGVLSAVAVPKFSRVLETRKTTEAEHVLTALRAEQEHRCVLGKEYQLQTGRTETLADAKSGKNYTYSLTRTGAKATSAKGYSIQMPSYKNGVLCCEGSYCNSLNKSYPSCNSVSVPQDECASSCSDCSCPEYAAGNPCACDAGYAAAHSCECANECSCEENPNQEKCQTCSNPTYAAAHRCECDANYAAANPCVCAPNTCACSSYASANPCVCAPNTCACPSYAFENRCECYGQNSKECCKASHRTWKDGRCVDICQDGYFWNQEAHGCEKDTGLSWQLTDCRSYHCCMGCPESEIGPYKCSGPCSEKGDSYTIRGALYPGNACPDEEICTCVCE